MLSLARAPCPQTAYNEEQFYPSHGTHASVGVSSRVMNYLCNMNSKTFFRFIREDSPLLHGYRPLSMHVNYHPEKPQRMVDLHAFYYLGDDKKGEKVRQHWPFSQPSCSRPAAPAAAMAPLSPPPFCVCSANRLTRLRCSAHPPPPPASPSPLRHRAGWHLEVEWRRGLATAS